jgi:monothiol glutaredoxin
MDVLDRIKQQVEGHPVLIYMKGTPQLPQCGFSSRTVEALKSLEVEFAYVNVLSDPDIFQNLPRFADWPTFPQVYVDGELMRLVICKKWRLMRSRKNLNRRL